MIDASAYTTIQSAIDAAPPYDGANSIAGATVYVRPGLYNESSRPAMTPLVIPDGVHLIGDGDISTVLHLSSLANKNNDIITVHGNHSGLSDLIVRGCNDATGTQRGVVWGLVGQPLRNLAMNRVVFEKTPANCLHVMGGEDGAGPNIEGRFSHCRFSGSLTGGLVKVLSGSTTQWFTDCEFQNPVGYCVYLSSAASSVWDRCVFEGGDDDDGVAATSKPFFWAGGNCVSLSILNSHFEAHGIANPNTKYFIQLDGKNHAVRIENNHFVRSFGRKGLYLWVNGGAGANGRKIKVAGNHGWIVDAAGPTSGDEIKTTHASDDVLLDSNIAFKSNQTLETAWVPTGPGSVKSVQYA